MMTIDLLSVLAVGNQCIKSHQEYLTNVVLSNTPFLAVSLKGRYFVEQILRLGTDPTSWNFEDENSLYFRRWILPKWDEVVTNISKMRKKIMSAVPLHLPLWTLGDI
jgi:hypothetical protein